MPEPIEHKMPFAQTKLEKLRTEPATTSELENPARPDTASTPKSHPPTVSFKDIDNDGDLDIVVTSPKGDQLYWLQNNLQQDSPELFQHAVFKSIIPTALTVGDVNDDGHNDVVIGHMSGAKVFSGGEHWMMKDIGIKLSSPQNIVLADVNNDGHTDIVFRDTREVLIALNADGNFGAHTLSWPNLGNSNLLAVANFDPFNQRPEIFTLDNEKYLNVATHDGSRWQAMRPVSSTPVKTFDVKDINNDGFDDILVHSENGQTKWLENDGKGGVIIHEHDDLPSPDTTLNDVKDTPWIPVNEEQIEFPPVHDQKPSAIFNFKHGCTIDPQSEPQRNSMPNGEKESLEPEPIQLSFDFTAPLNVDFNYDPGTTVDFSSSFFGVDIDLLNGEAQAEIPWAPWYYWLMAPDGDSWNNTDQVVNAIGSRSADNIYGSYAANHIDGGKGSDYIYGGDGKDTLIGNDGNDIIVGGNDDDILTGNQGYDILLGGQGNDIADGGSGNDLLFGWIGEDTLIGGLGNDIIQSGDGNDLLYGGRGSDTLYGGDGSDIFYYSSTKDGGDVIKDFTVGEDKLAFDFGPYELLTVFEPYTGECGEGGEAFVWESTVSGTGKLYYDADISTVGNETLIATIDLVKETETLTISDFGLI